MLLSRSALIPLLPLLSAPALPALADPSFECSGSSQVEIGNCMSATADTVDAALVNVYTIATAAAAGLDETTDRPLAVPALQASQAAWEAWRDAQCDFVGTTFGGGSGTGIAITGCRIELGRARINQLLETAN